MGTPAGNFVDSMGKNLKGPPSPKLRATEAVNFIFERARPLSFCKGHSVGKL